MLKGVRALKKRESNFNFFWKTLNMDYVDIPFSQNSALPSWMNFKFKNNILEIYGCMPSGLSLKDKTCNYIIKID